MNSQQHTSPPFSFIFAAVVLTTTFVLLSSSQRVSSQDPQRASEATQKEIELVPPGQEKQLRIRMGSQIPLKFEVRNLNSKKWAHDLEVEVTNTSDRPIYFFHFFITLPEVRGSTGHTVGFWMHYGRGKLVDFSTPLEKDDIPLLPGEKFTFKLTEGAAKGWDYMKEVEGRPEPKKILIEFQSINFGDGTGYDDVKRVDTRKKINFNQNWLPPPNGCYESYRLLSDTFLPASFLPVKFFGAETSGLFSPNSANMDSCGCAGSCQYVKATFYTCGRTCDPGNDAHPSQTSVGCTDPTGGCKTIATRQVSCNDPNTGLPLYCTDTTLFSCSAGAGFEGDGATCSDGIDNDEDGFTDCEEPDCAFEPYCNGGGGCFAGPISGAKTSSRISNSIINPSCCDDSERLLCFQGGGEWSESQCACYSPIVIDVTGNGFGLTNAQNGVMFDIPGSGTVEQVSWTAANSDDAWLALDRNGNGLIDNGKELFGSSTPQPFLSKGESKNGFRALAVFDTAPYGGNDDGLIDRHDSVFYSLKLWQDRNHNGISEAGELQSFSASVIAVIELKYKESRHRDDNGNWFRYRAKVRDLSGAQAGRWAWDVFLQKPE